MAAFRQCNARHISRDEARSRQTSAGASTWRLDTDVAPPHSESWDFGQPPLETEGRVHAGYHCRVAGRLVFDRSVFTHQFLYRWLNCCGPTSGKPEKGYGEYEEGGNHHGSRRVQEHESLG